MSKRISAEERVLQFFREQPLPVAEAMLRLATAEVRARKPAVKRVRKAPEPLKVGGGNALSQM